MFLSSFTEISSGVAFKNTLWGETFQLQ
ncbi:UNVERIFIED_CONTAM: hypothetical protein GTU68_062326 [Idotea baltica]|nr:hypothetical protein [Idotea baltica]